MYCELPGGHSQIVHAIKIPCGKLWPCPIDDLPYTDLPKIRGNFLFLAWPIHEHVGTPLQSKHPSDLINRFILVW